VRRGPAISLLRLAAAALILIGLAVCAGGALRAVGEIRAVYEGTADDPLAIPEISEEERGERMHRACDRRGVGASRR
jgi:hypothetical protein